MKRKIVIIGSSVVYEKYLKFTDTMTQVVRGLIDFKVVNAFEKVSLGDYEITPLPARHGSMTGFIYDIKRGISAFYTRTIRASFLRALFSM